MAAVVLAGVLLVVVILFVLHDTRKPRGYPPGPAWLPLVGSYLYVQRRLSRRHYHHLVWADLACEYGAVAGLRLGKDNIVVVSGYTAVREVLTRGEFQGRPDGFFFRLRALGRRLGVVFSDGSLWHEQKQFLLRRLRTLGFGTPATEAAELVSWLRTCCARGSPVAMHCAFDVAVLNSLWAVMAGRRFDHDDGRLGRLLALVHLAFRSLDMSGGILNQMPFLRHVAPGRSGYTRVLTCLRDIWAFLRETITEHRHTLTPGLARDLIDSFLMEMDSHKSPSFSEDQLLTVCLDLFMAGSETTSNTLSFAVLYMVLHPEVQRRAQDELDAVVGRDRMPALEDRRRLSYVEAVIMEVQRRANVAPVSVPHRTLKDTTLMEHVIPQNTTVLVSLWSVHMDADHWGDPEVFRPDRFLDSEGRLVLDDWFMPFGLGKRRCLGESLAKHSLFLFFSSLLHCFTLAVPDGHLPPSELGYDGVTLSPTPFWVRLTPRG